MILKDLSRRAPGLLTALALLLAVMVSAAAATLLTRPGWAAQTVSQTASSANAVPALFSSSGCPQCHGPALAGTGKGPALAGIGRRLSRAQIVAQIHNGGGAMPAYGDVLTATEIRQLADSLARSQPLSIPAPPQHAEPSAAAPASAGVNTGGAHAPTVDAEHRAITAGGFVQSGPVVFEDITAKAGLSGWTHSMGTSAKRYILETTGSGVALLDFDGDGWLDIYLVNGSTYAALAGKAAPPHAALFRNNHDGTFTDVAAKAGVTNDRWGFGAVVGDFDNDGWPDLYVTNYGGNRLYRNNHDGTFTDVAPKAGVVLDNWSSGATWGDYDGDGRLDLFVPGYVHIDAAELTAASVAAGGRPGAGGALDNCQFRGVSVMCGPRGLHGEPDHLFHNNGDGTFTEVSRKAGVSDPRGYFGLSSLFVDINGDGRPDLLVADDSTPNFLYLNHGDGTFEDASFVSGYALNESGRETASMGIAVGDYLHNGLLDVYNTTFSDDYNPLYRNDGDANFTDISYEAGIAEPTIPFLGWGTSFFDFDNDGWLDLFVVNGHVYPEVDRQSWGTSYAQRPLLFHNLQGKLKLMPAVAGTGLARIATARGMAFGDLFNDGKIDVVINNMDAPPALLRNVTAHAGHFIELSLVGGPGSPRDAVGATVLLTANGFTQRADVLAGGSYASSPDQRLHFGLGPATTIDRIEIRWPDGTRQAVAPPAVVDRLYRVIEGSAPVPLR